MNSFNKELQAFLVDGKFNNNLDDAGNVNLSIDPIDINQKYIQFSFKNYVYNNEQIKTLYDVNVKEFSIPTSISINNSSENNRNQLIQENETLRNQLNTIINADNQNSASAIVDASRDIIIKLRIQLNEGSTVDDFSDVFPYLKK